MASETKKTKAASKRPADTKTNGTAAERAGLATEEVRLPEQYTVEVAIPTYTADHFGHEELGLSADDLVAMYRNMLLQRRFEERSAQMYGKQKISGFLHLYIGQEAVSTGTAWALDIGLDSVITAYRDHGIALALGMTSNECMAELFGKIDGCSRGKGGSMHFFSREKGLYGGHGIVGGHIPLGVGLAFAHKYQDDGGVSVTFFGDGAMGQGAFHEAANLAGLYELPAILVVENNQYAMGTSIHRAFADPALYKQALPFNMDIAVINGMDVLCVYKAMKDHVEKARAGRPSFLEIRTYRYRGHSMSDPQKYRTKEELEQKKNEDPILRLKAYLLKHELSDNDTLDALDEEVKEEVNDAVDFAENSPFPPLETIYEDVYTQDDYPFLA